ncbi:MAG TPA: hypothetical protein VNX21_06320 [Candidatus Thermoplasmatota archaeon]|nr:hypothetical protein [Candidatus Thermoplasmatota archaeon]
MRPILALCLTATILATSPLATAASYSHSGTLHARYAFVAVASGHLFDFTASQGDLIEVTLTWTDATKDLDLRLLGAGTACNVNPDPDAPCIVDAALREPDCIGDRPLTGPHGSETLTLAAPASGAFSAAVVAAAAPGATAYTLTISVAGQAPSVTGPVEASFVDRHLACKVP